MTKQCSRKGIVIKMLTAIVLLLVLVFLGFCLWLAGYVMTGRRQTLDEAMAWQSDHYDTSFYDTLEKTTYTVPGCKGYVLHVQELRNPTPTDRWMILSHGYTDNRIGSLKYVPTYLSLGFNCVIYDLRGHGENEKTYTTYGVLEAKDLALLIADTRSRHPELTQLGLHGESLGASTTVTVLQYRPDVNFVVADCGFSDIMEVLRDGYRSAGAPAFLADMADIGSCLRYHISLRRMRPIESLNENNIPALFIHGENDTFILPKHAQKMYDRDPGVKALRLIGGAGHAESVLKAPETYRACIAEFLQDLS